MMSLGSAFGKGWLSWKGSDAVPHLGIRSGAKTDRMLIQTRVVLGAIHGVGFCQVPCNGGSGQSISKHAFDINVTNYS